MSKYKHTKMGIFERSNKIFQEEDYLREDYQPEEIKKREQEMEEYISSLQPVINNSQPRNIFLYGKTGTGKTAITKHLLDHLKQDAQQYQDLKLNIIHLNCNNLSSSYQVAANLVNRIKEKTNQEKISTTGYPKQALFDKLYQEMNDIGGTILIVLDEIDNIEDDDILYELPRARANDKLNNNVKPGIIGISNNFKFYDNLSPKVKDTLCEDEIYFTPYDATELESILQDRADKAFQDNVLESDVVPLCSALAAKDSGSARQGLELLYKSGDIARRNESKIVKEKHVRRAEQVLEKKHVKQGVRRLTTHGHLTLLAIAKLTDNKKPPFRIKNIYPKYEKLAEDHMVDPLVRRRVYDHLRDLEMLGILEVKERYEGRRGGSYYEYELNISLDAVLDVFQDLENIDNLKYF